MPLRVSLLLACLAFATAAAPASSATAPLARVGWPAFLSRHDLVWEQLPRQWNKGAEVLLFPAGRELPVASVEALPASGVANPYGVKLGGGLTGDQSWPVPARPLPATALP